jgi:hypothetical protein
MLLGHSQNVKFNTTKKKKKKILGVGCDSGGISGSIFSVTFHGSFKMQQHVQDKACAKNVKSTYYTIKGKARTKTNFRAHLFAFLGGVRT